VIRKWGKRELGVTLDTWQTRALTKAMRYDRNGDLIARLALISTARQNGKTAIIRVLIGWVLDEGRHLDAFKGWNSILTAAHDARQARLPYNRVRRDIDNHPRLSTEMRSTQFAGITAGDLDLDIVTGQPGSVRGEAAGLVLWDEVLSQKNWLMFEALGPTQTAQRSPLMVMTSTAGHADSVVLRWMFDRMQRQAAGDEKPDPTFYACWWQSEDPNAQLDWRQVGQANPALGDGRLTKAALTSQHALLPADSWRREILNHWSDTKADSVFNPGVWSSLRTPTPLLGLTGPYALGVDVDPGWTRATICVGGIRVDGRVGVEVYRDIRSSVTAAHIIEEVERFPDPVRVIAFDSVSGAAASFERRGLETGQPWDALKPGAMVACSMDFYEMTLSGRLAVDDPLLDAQIPLVAKRAVGQDGAFRFARGSSLGPIDAVIAAALAAHGIAYTAPPNIHI
jgi:hypothetical protein